MLGIERNFCYQAYSENGNLDIPFNSSLSGAVEHQFGFGYVHRFRSTPV